MSDLFRREAIEHANYRLQGEVTLNSPVSMRLMTGLLLAALLVGGAFLTNASYARKETVSGWLTPEGGLIQVASSRAGVLEQLFAVEGNAVRQGQPLAIVRSATSSLNGNRDGELLERLAEESRTRADMDRAVAAKLNAEMAGLRDRRSALSSEIRTVEAQLGTLEEAQGVAEQQLARGLKLQEKGFMAASSVDSRRAAVLSSAYQAQSVKTRLAGYRRQLADIDAQLNELPADLAAARAGATQAQLALSDRRTSTEAEYAAVATAPLKGRVLSFPVKIGQKVRAGDTVAILAPGSGRLVAELYVPTKAAGFIRAGQDVRLMYAAYPFDRFGAGHGTVEAVSRTALAPSQVDLPGQAFAEPMFKVTVRLSEDTVRAYGRRMPLQPGMLLAADVVIDERSLFQWVLEPLYAAGRRG